MFWEWKWKYKWFNGILLNESKTIKKNINKKMSKGMSYPKAIGETINTVLEDNKTYPNNILGIEYIKAILKLKSNIKPITIKRIKNDYNETVITGSISSATAIREEIKSNELNDNVSISVPKNSFDIMKNNITNKRGPIFFEDFSDLILYQLRKSTLSELYSLPYVKEGIEYRLKLSVIQEHIYNVFYVIFY